MVTFAIVLLRTWAEGDTQARPFIATAHSRPQDTNINRRMKCRQWNRTQGFLHKADFISQGWPT